MLVNFYDIVLKFLKFSNLFKFYFKVYCQQLEQYDDLTDDQLEKLLEEGQRELEAEEREQEADDFFKRKYEVPKDKL